MRRFSKLVSMLWILLGCLPAAAETYRIGVVSWVGWSPVHVAAELGFFKDEGLDVDIQWFAGPKEIADAFQNDRVHLRYDFVATVVAEARKGGNLALLAETNWSHGGDKIIVKNGTTFRQGKGTKIGIYRDSPALLYFLNIYLRNQKMSLKDFKVVQAEPEVLLSDFKNGKLNYMVAFDPYTIPAVTEGDGRVVANSGQFPGCMPEGIFGKREVVDAIPEEDKVKLMRALIRAADWIDNKKNWPAFQKILNTRVLPDQRAFNEKELNALMISVKIHNRKTLLARNKENGGVYRYLGQMKGFLKRLDNTNPFFEPTVIMDNGALLKALGK
ncbi:MAG: ABC transporter substrate-binding protein [Acidobacteriota bacterium]|nr:ABC transporter substrate-binding protein [Acidobacteriota bacterium]